MAQKMELRGFDPLTSSLLRKRATNCATVPNEKALSSGFEPLTP